MVVAQLVEWSLPITEASGSNPVIGNIYIEHLLSNVLKRRKMAKNGPFKKKKISLYDRGKDCMATFS